MFKIQTTKQKKQTKMTLPTKRWPSQKDFAVLGKRFINWNDLKLNPFEFDLQKVQERCVYADVCLDCGKKQLQADALIHQQLALLNKQPQTRCECDQFRPGTEELDTKLAKQKFGPYAQQLAACWVLVDKHGSLNWENHLDESLRYNTQVQHISEEFLNLILKQRHGEK